MMSKNGNGDIPDKVKDPEGFYNWIYKGIRHFLSITVIEVGGSKTGAGTKYIYVPEAKQHNVQKGEKAADAIWVDKTRLLYLLNHTTIYNNKDILLVTFKTDKKEK